MRDPVEVIGRATERLESGLGGKRKEKEVPGREFEVEEVRPELRKPVGRPRNKEYRVGLLRCPILDAAPKRCSVHATNKGVSLCFN